MTGLKGAQVQSVTLGCRLNIVETEDLLRLAPDEPATAAIVNTCAVTAEAVRRSRQAVRRMVREQLHGDVIVTGCAATIDPSPFLATSPRVRVVPNDQKPWDRGTGRTTQTAARERDHTRGFVAVQNGCDHRCTFCVIPFGRGESRSKTAETVVAEIRDLVESGAADVVLTGVDLTAWGADLSGDRRLGDLVMTILREVPHLPRLRLSSVDCIEIDNVLLDLIASEERLMPHLHLSLQAGDDLILKRMKRRHSRAGAVRLCERLRKVRPDIVLGADLIAGFPTETDDMFANTLALIEDCGLTHLHVFPYSLRPGTPAARMPHLPATVVTLRAARLREEAGRRLACHLQDQVGKTLQILTERGAVGRSPDFTAVRMPAGSAPGSFNDVRIVAHDGTHALAEGA